MTTLQLAAWSSEDLVRWGIVFFVFVLPALKGILESRKRAAEEAKKPARPARRPRPAPDDDDDPWGRLLRGETVARPAAPPPPPVLPPPPPRRPLERSLELPADPALERSLEHTAPAERSLDHVAPGERRLAHEGPAFDDRLSNADAYAQESLPELETALPMIASVRGAAGLGDPFGAFGTMGPAQDEPHEVALELEAIDWRSALIHSEILGPPLALRGDGGARIP